MRRRDLFAVLAGAAIAWPPFSTRAQQKAMPVIGWLSSTSLGSSVTSLAAFRQGLSEAGYVEGKNLGIEYRWAEGRYNRLPTLAADLVGRKVDLMVAIAPPAALAAKTATTTTPIVFSVGTDPVAAGLVASLARPGGNLTGVSLLYTDLTPKRLELLFELVPQARMIAVLVNPTGPEAEPTIRAAEEVARTKGLGFGILKASTESEIDTAFATLTQTHADVLLIGGDPFYGRRREQLVSLASRYAIPTIYVRREFVIDGGLLSYGESFAAAFRQVAIYVGKILHGAKPAELPVERPTRYELVVNLKTAKALGLTIPPAILARVDEVIE